MTGTFDPAEAHRMMVRMHPTEEEALVDAWGGLAGEVAAVLLEDRAPVRYTRVAVEQAPRLTRR